jgi:hypothetical protein
MQKSYTENDKARILNHIEKAKSKTSEAKRQGISMPTYYRWRSLTGPLKDDQRALVQDLQGQVKKLKQLLFEKYLEEQLKRFDEGQ